MRIGAHQPARAEQDPAEISCDNARHIINFLTLQNLQNRHARRAARLAVIGKARRAVLDDVGIDIVRRVPVGLAHLFEPRKSLLLRIRAENMSDEA